MTRKIKVDKKWYAILNTGARKVLFNMGRDSKGILYGNAIKDMGASDYVAKLHGRNIDISNTIKLNTDSYALRLIIEEV